MYVLRVINRDTLEIIETHCDSLKVVTQLVHVAQIASAWSDAVDFTLFDEDNNELDLFEVGMFFHC